MLKKVLIANRGEIALRILRACQDIGLKTVAIYSTADANAKHVRLADQAICIGPGPAKDSYLNMSAIMAAAEISGADAVHPGYGFFSENAEFARMVIDHGMVFIGPTPEHIHTMGDKIIAKKYIKALGIPVVPGSEGEVKTIEDALKIAEEMGYPVLVKASAGGGGKGMQVAQNAEELRAGFPLARQEAQVNFGVPDVFLEKYLQKPRHIEIQVICDHHGHAVHLGERDCSIQRRHQKLWEEAPSPTITEAQRQNIGAIVTKACIEMGYHGAGTFEFLYEDGEFYFIEMNTRIQVEHPVSEFITGIDLVAEQLKVAGGLPLSFTQDDITIKGHAIECRINAEDSETFAPCPGKVNLYHTPGGPGIRVDSALYAGYHIPQFYDSMVAKLIVHGDDRAHCMRRLKRALAEFVIGDVKTTLPLHRLLVEHPDMLSGEYNIHWLEKFIKKNADEKAAATNQ